jgi:hypothetical protein
LIVNFKSEVLACLWTTGDISVLPSTYVYDIIEILDLLDASETILDIEKIGEDFKIEEYKPLHWAVTVTVNNIEYIGSVTCYFHQNKMFDVDFKQYG